MLHQTSNYVPSIISARRRLLNLYYKLFKPNQGGGNISQLIYSYQSKNINSNSTKHKDKYGQNNSKPV